MKLIFWNLRELWKEQRLFFALLILVQALAAFCLSFVVGVIVNNYFFAEMDFAHNSVGFNLTEPVTYGEIEETVKFIFDDILKGGGRELELSQYEGELLKEDYTLNEDFFLLACSVNIENGRYVPGRFLTDLLQKQLKSGRAFTEAELNGEEYKAIVIENRQEGEELVFHGKTYEIIGERLDYGADDTLTSAFVCPNNFLDERVDRFEIQLNRYISKPEYEAILSALDQVIAGKYEAGHYGKTFTGDVRAVMRSMILACVLIGLVLFSCLGVVYQHILEKRTYKLAIFRLTGCSALGSLGRLFLEMLFLSAPALALGLGSMYWLQKRKLEGVYPYMGLYLDKKMYLLFFAGLLAFVSLFQLTVMAAKQLRPVKAQLLAARQG